MLKYQQNTQYQHFQLLNVGLTIIAKRLPANPQLATLQIRLKLKGENRIQYAIPGTTIEMKYWDAKLGKLKRCHNSISVNNTLQLLHASLPLR